MFVFVPPNNQYLAKYLDILKFFHNAYNNGYNGITYISGYNIYKMVMSIVLKASL